ncbi:MAG: hypothetical protein J0G98_11090 [Terrimonas ferruginea]|uniref:hypothetical protein n=1 Tax=Terrimonas ferruginea TaxID=249 RepID=UPI00092B83B6|nr:hypothetical protein [Terrimonas ferruginea]MBN8783601.1 hypothetical protein [Terrimonas ferruginea]OJW40347.1 MAG: hypothetical protein BGO56_09900 [Sphingobacteriales bacterium 48-107]
MKLLIALLLTFALSANAQKTAWNELGLKGKVKSLQIKQTHRYKKNGVFTPWENSYGYLTKFNSTGYRTEYNEFLGNDSLSYRITYTYTPKEKKADLTYFSKELKPTIKKKYLYDDKGRHIDQLEYTMEGELDRRYTYKYDDRGNLIEISGYKKDGTLSSKTTYTYDSKNNKTDYLMETPGYANSYRKFVYDEKGNPVEETWLNGRKEVDFKFVRLFDAKGNKIQETNYKQGTKLIGTTRWIYEYDAKGNWTKKTDVTEDGVDFHTETRTIIYY